MVERRAFADLLSYPLRSGVTVPSAQRGAGIKMLNMGELFANPRIGDVSMARVEIDTTNHDRLLLRKGDLMFARRSLTLEGAGKCAIIREVVEATTWESSIIRARLDPAICSAEYYFYYFSSPIGRRQMESIVEQVAAAGIRLSELARLNVPVPSLSEQREIAEVLGALDDKIAANTKLASTADELVRSWYERTTSQASAMTSVGSLAAQVRDLVDPAEVGVGEIYVGLEHVPRRHMWLNDAGAAGSVTSTKAAFRANDVLFGKLRPYFHKVVAAPVSGVSSTDILVLRARESLLAGYLLAVAASDQVVERCTAASEGTRMPRTSWADLAAIEVPWPGDEEARRLSARVVELRSRVEAALVENHTLAATRDALLPQLMSGKLRVRDAERVVSEVA